MKNRILGTALIAAVAFSTSVTAAGHDPVEARIALMKSVGAAAGASGKMMQGQMEFTPEAALEAITALNAAALALGDKFPAGTESDSRSSAAPAIWTDTEGFQAAVAKFAADTQAAVDNPPTDVAAFGAAFGAIASNCRACHESYRIRKN